MSVSGVTRSWGKKFLFPGFLPGPTKILVPIILIAGTIFASNLLFGNTARIDTAGSKRYDPVRGSGEGVATQEVQIDGIVYRGEIMININKVTEKKCRANILMQIYRVSSEDPFISVYSQPFDLKSCNNEDMAKGIVDVWNRFVNIVLDQKGDPTRANVYLAQTSFWNARVNALTDCFIAALKALGITGG